MFELLPSSYYDLSGSVSLLQLLQQFLVTDFFTYAMHRLEHAWPALYQRSHKAHHKVWQVGSRRLFLLLTLCAVDVATVVQCLQRLRARHNLADSDPAISDPSSKCGFTFLPLYFSLTPFSSRVCCICLFPPTHCFCFLQSLSIGQQLDFYCVWNSVCGPIYSDSLRVRASLGLAV